MQERLVDTNKILKITFKFSVPGYLSKIKGIFTFYKSSCRRRLNSRCFRPHLCVWDVLTCLFETSFARRFVSKRWRMTIKQVQRSLPLIFTSCSHTAYNSSKFYRWKASTIYQSRSSIHQTIHTSLPSTLRIIYYQYEALIRHAHPCRRHQSPSHLRCWNEAAAS